MQDRGWLNKIPKYQVEEDEDSDMVHQTTDNPVVHGLNNSKKRRRVYTMGYLFIWIEADQVDLWNTTLPMNELQDYANTQLKTENIWEVIQAVNWEDTEPIAFAHVRPIPARQDDEKSLSNKILCFKFPVFRVQRK